MEDSEKVELYERFLKAIARQPDNVMYEGPEVHPAFKGSSRQHWAQTALGMAGVEDYSTRDPYKE